LCLVELRGFEPLTPCMPWTARPGERRCSEPSPLVKARAQLSAGHRCCPLLSAGSCPKHAPAQSSRAQESGVTASVRESAGWWWRPAADGRFWPVSWEDAEPLMTGVVRCGLVVRGPDVAPLWPRPILRSHEAAGCPFPPPSEPVRAWGLLGEYVRHPGNALVADPHFREG
jgi:hypothetical protein